jgi:O-antigen biosynthesis alpha-1,2-rhamnosyltransferase
MTIAQEMRPPVLYVECTPTIRFDHGTGISRVVRNVVQHAVRSGHDRGIDVRPIVFSNGDFFPARLTPEGRFATLAESESRVRWKRRTKEGIRDAIYCAGRMLPPGRARQWWLASGKDPGLTKTLQDILRRVRRPVADSLASVAAMSAAVKFAPGDTVLAAEPLLDRSYVAAFLALRERGVRLACVVYDLIPIRYPQYVSAEFLAVFRDWVDRLVAGSDLIVAISSVVRDDISGYLAELRDPAPRPGQRVAWFHLGRDLDRVNAGGDVRRKIVRIFDRAGSDPVFLMVGWLDPRKNQAFVLKAMARLRRENIAMQMVVIAKRGLGTNAFHTYLNADPELARSVHAFHDATDTELEFCYRHAAALVYPSTTEGFGLPLVEALGHGLPVFASDIPIFRELGEGFVSYFPLDDPEILTGKLRRFCVDGVYDAPRPIAEFRWPAWGECVDTLLDIVFEQGGAKASA